MCLLWQHGPVTNPFDVSRVPVPLLVAVDTTAFVVFVLVGLDRHAELTTFDALARNLLPLLGAWFAAGALFGTYRRPGMRTLLLTWGAAVPLGLALRTVWVGSPDQAGKIAIFFAVALVFTLLFLVVARSFAALLTAALGRVRESRA